MASAPGGREKWGFSRSCVERKGLETGDLSGVEIRRQRTTNASITKKNSERMEIHQGRVSPLRRRRKKSKGDLGLRLVCSFTSAGKKGKDRWGGIRG